jgi:hypothetical protein
MSDDGSVGSDYDDYDDIEEIDEDEEPEEDGEDKESDDEGEEEDLLQIFQTESKGKLIKKENRRCFPFLTTFERVKVLGQRVDELNEGEDAKINLDDPLEFSGDRTEVIDIAKAELLLKRLTYSLKKVHPNGDYEIWQLNELKDLTL